MGIEWEADDHTCIDLINHLNNVVIPNSKNLKIDQYRMVQVLG